MAENLFPRPAATVLTLRDRPNGYEILMLRRNVRSDFVAGAFVFPGGALDEEDADCDDLVVGLGDDEASKRLEIEEGGLAYYVAGLRELFEEAGLLVACDEHKIAVNFTAPARQTRVAVGRDALNAGTTSFAAFLREERLRLDLRGVEYLAHWVTPVGMPRRYDTRFFVALAPNGQVAAHDDGETVEHRWVRPREALAAHARGEFEMVLPTIRNLSAIADYERAEDVFQHARSVLEARIEPRIVDQAGSVVILTPGDEGFEAPAP